VTVNPQRLARLQEYGLTEYEARAYLALLDLDMAEASHIADLSRVPRTKIYQALDGLESKHLLKVIPERPKRYVVQPFTGYLEELEKGLLAKASGIGSQKETLAAEFAPKGRVVVEDAGGFLVLKGRANIASKLCEMITNSDVNVAVLASAPAARRLAYHAETLNEKARRGVNVRVLSPATNDVDPQVESLSQSAETRHTQFDFGAVTLMFVDDREMILAHHVPDDHHYFQGSDVAFWTDDQALVASLKALFTLAWSLSEENASTAATRAAQKALAAAIGDLRLPA